MGARQLLPTPVAISRYYVLLPCDRPQNLKIPTRRRLQSTLPSLLAALGRLGVFVLAVTLAGVGFGGKQALGAGAGEARCLMGSSGPEPGRLGNGRGQCQIPSVAPLGWEHPRDLGREPLWGWQRLSGWQPRLPLSGWLRPARARLPRPRPTPHCVEWTKSPMV